MLPTDKGKVEIRISGRPIVQYIGDDYIERSDMFNKKHVFKVLEEVEGGEIQLYFDGQLIAFYGVKWLNKGDKLTLNFSCFQEKLN